MRFITEDKWDLWTAGNFAEPNKPVTRAVITKSVLRKYGPWRSLVFGQSQPLYEIPNIKTVTLDSRHQSDAATMTMTILNQVEADPLLNLDEPHAGDIIPPGGPGTVPTRRELKDLAHPGFYSFRRGITPSSMEKWGHGVDPIWVDMFIPNRVIRTFQGYGSDGAIDAWNDTKLTLTGTWLIDSVNYDTKGIITITCRDAAKLLIEQRLYPPIVPVAQYPIDFCATEVVTTSETYEVIEEEGQEAIVGTDVAHHMSTTAQPGSTPRGVRAWDSSSAPWYGYNVGVYGHKASHAFDGDGSTYWLSVGNSGPNKVWSFEWIGAETRGEPIRQVRFRPKIGGYVCYVAVKEDGKWQGSNRVPYGKNSEPAFPNGSDKLYVKKVNIPRNENWVNIDLGRTYNADQVWLIFTNLANFNIGTYPYRAGVIEMEVMGFTPGKEEVVKEEERDVETIIPGNITDYTDMVKVLAAWAGFYWPYGTSDPILRFWEEDLIDSSQDPILDGIEGDGGRVWGDFFYSGAFPVEPACIPSSFFDNKSVMDAINAIKEILGFIVYVDAGGALVWRMPNIWRTGNFITGKGYIGVDSVRDVSETQVILDYGVTIDDANLRSEIIVVAKDPAFHTAIQPGYVVGETTEGNADPSGAIPNAVEPEGDLALLGGQDRILLVPDYPFISQEEVEKFAYLISLWIHWSYRKGKFRIPGNAAFEPDDQVRIFERITSESYIHYIQGVRSAMDLDAGTWFLDIDTHWLGNGPDATWVINTYRDMPPALYEYLVSVGYIDEEGDPTKLPEGEYEFVIPNYTPEIPRLDEDLEEIFPDPPTIAYPYDDSWSDKAIADDIGSNWAVDPTATGGGTVNSKTEAWRYKFWGSRGSDLTTFNFMIKWETFYAGLPAEDVPKNTHVGQLRTTRTQCPRGAVAAYKLLAELLADEGYYVFSSAAYAGRERRIANSTTYSAHAWGIAIDINPSINPCCREQFSQWIARSQSPKFYAAAQNITSRIRTKSGNHRVFGWGGFWDPTKKVDWMHFELIRTRSELSGGVRLV